MSDESINKNFHLKKRKEISLEKYVAGILSRDDLLVKCCNNAYRECKSKAQRTC